MANYSYDEAGNMAAYFLLTFLFIILIPLSLSSLSSRKLQAVPGCQCRLCIAQRESIRKRERGSILKPKFRRKTLFLIAGWSLVAFLVYKISTTEVENKVYDPFEILGIRSGVDVKEIKSHYKKLSRKFHPDKVKLGMNETMEAVEAKFVEITKAYKSLTDETIRKNWETYGHPDGRQEISMGIALPKWIVESGNNIWVLGVYGAIFGGALPAMVGRWWFGNRQKTKDGVDARSAATFFKNLSEDSGINDVVGSLEKTFEWEGPNAKVAKREAELLDLESKVGERLRGKWDDMGKLTEAGGEHESWRRALILIYAHLLRLPIQSTSLRHEQAQLLLQTPALLNSMLNISASRSWLLPTLSAIRLQAYLVQAILPGQEQFRFAQLPDVSGEEAAESFPRAGALEDFIASLEEKGDDRVPEVKKALQKWGKAELVDASFRVLGERYITPSSIVYLVVKLRLLSPSTDKVADEQAPRANENRDNEFLASRKDAEAVPQGEVSNIWAHAPYWPANRKPGWWIVLTDVKTSRIMVAPMRVTDIPVGQDYRSFKVQMQAPPNPSVIACKLYVISDTFVGEEVSKDIKMKVDDASILNVEEQDDDDISEPEEDSLAGQMALMRGGAVKKRREDESDDESSTDDDRRSDSGSSSDSD
ncbi:hypothetical protein AcW1_004093 [Taiwanofungus camphoratus]|nr:hypothetical protein AcV5_000472 [Antrodia cinnamomea]KAI0959188.1 hypothetical protein AcW1_004093 [Antrodia cinnamomea]